MYNHNKISNFYFDYYLFSNMIYYYGNIKPAAKGGKGDISKILEYFDASDIKVTKNDFEKSIIFSLLFSQFTYSSLYSLFTGNHFIKPLQYNGFIFPDVFPYITTKGISYRIKSAYRYSDDLIFRFGTEFVAYGKSAIEFIFGVNTKFIGNNRLDFMTVFGMNGINIETRYMVPLTKSFRINFDFNLHSTKSLYGERNAYNFYDDSDLKRQLNYSYYFGLSISYLF